MNIFEQHGEVMLQQHEGNRQLASALADGTRLLLQRFTKFLVKVLCRVPGAHSV